LDGEVVAWQPGRGVYGGNLQATVTATFRRRPAMQSGSMRVVRMALPDGEQQVMCQRLTVASLAALGQLDALGNDVGASVGWFGAAYSVAMRTVTAGRILPQLTDTGLGWWIARWKRVPFVFEVRDLWPESLAAVGMGDGSSMLHRSLAKIAGFLYRRSDRIVVVTHAFEDYLVQHWRVPREKISVVENGVETDLFVPQPGTDVRMELRAEGKFVVSYIGTMGMAHGLETIIAAAPAPRYRAAEVRRGIR